MIENFAHFHDSNDSRLYQELSIFFNVFMCGFLLNLQFGLQRDVNVYAIFFAIEKNVQLIDYSHRYFVSKIDEDKK